MAQGAGPTPFPVHRLRVYVEAAGAATYGVDHTGTLGDFEDVPLAEGSHQFAPIEETHNPMQALQDKRGYQEEILGKKTWTLSFTTPFYATGVAAASAVTAVQSAIGKMLKAIMGGEFLGTGTTVSTGWSTAGAGNVAVATGRFMPGGIAGWADTSGIVHFRPIKHVTGKQLGLKVRFPSAPATGAVIYSGATYYFTQDADTSLQFIVEGYEQQDRWVALGGQGTVTPQLALDGTIQTLQWTFTGTRWLMGSDAAGAANIHGTNLGIATYSNYEPLTGHVGRPLWKTNGAIAFTAGVTELDLSEVDIKTNMEPTAVPSPLGVEGVKRWVVTRAPGTPPVQATIGRFFTGYSFLTDKANKYDKLFFYQNGVTASKVTIVDLPTVQVTDVQSKNGGGIRMEVATVKGRLDGGTTGVTAAATNYDLATSPVRYSFG